MTSYLYINSIREKPSLSDGPGYRTILFLQGCNLRCKGCQNPQTWDMKIGTKVSCDALAKELKEKCLNKELTISGGEPLMQTDSLCALFEQLKGFDICLYTGHKLSEVPSKIIKYLKWLKVGEFDESKKTSLKPYVGSTNQEMLEIVNGKIKNYE